MNEKPPVSDVNPRTTDNDLGPPDGVCVTDPTANVPTPRTVDDTLNRLLAQVAQGDREAFAVLYDRLAPVVHGVSRHVLSDLTHAEANTKDAFVEVWRQAPRLSATNGDIVIWLTVVAHRGALARSRGQPGRSATSGNRSDWT